MDYLLIGCGSMTSIFQQQRVDIRIPQLVFGVQVHGAPKQPVKGSWYESMPKHSMIVELKRGLSMSLLGSSTTTIP